MTKQIKAAGSAAGRAAGTPVGTAVTVGAGGGALLGIITVIRILAGDKMPWSESEDLTVAGVLTPIVAGLVHLFRRKKKVADAK